MLIGYIEKSVPRDFKLFSNFKVFHEKKKIINKTVNTFNGCSSLYVVASAWAKWLYNRKQNKGRKILKIQFCYTEVNHKQLQKQLFKCKKTY